MFGSKEETTISADKVDTIVGQGTTLEGTITGQGSLRIDGGLDGDISYEGDVIVGESAEVDATIRARHVTVAGEVRGNVEVQGRCEILNGGILIGDVVSEQLVIEEGGILDGRSSMTHDRAPSKKPASAPEDNPADDNG